MDSIAFQKGHFCYPSSPKWKVGRALAPAAPLSDVPVNNYWEWMKNKEMWKNEQLQN